MNRISKKSTICAILCMLCCVIIFAGCGKSNENVKNQDSISYLHADFAIDMNNQNEVIGFSDHYFIAKVVKEEKVEYRDPVVVETKSGTKEVSIPYTHYTIRVIKNIKGELPTEENILLIKCGGRSKDGQMILYENDQLLVENSTYIFAACVQPDGSLLISGPNLSEIIDESKLSSKEVKEETLGKYVEMYKQEVKYDRERFEYKK